MTLILNFFDFLCGLFEITSIIICLNIFGVYNIKAITKLRFTISLSVYVSVALFYYLHISTYGTSFGFLLTILYLVKLIFPLYLMLGSINLKICYLTVFMESVVTFFSDSTTCIISNVLKIVPAKIYPTVSLCVQVSMLVLLLIIIKKADTKSVNIILKMIPARVFILLLLTVIYLGLLVSLVNFNTDNNLLKETLLMVLIITLALFLAYIITLLFMNVIAKQHFTTTSQMMEKQVELQINHYKELEKMDAEMRRFRHDYTNHLRSVLSLIQMKEYSDAEEYIEKIQNKAYTSGAVLYYTGNKLADAILADKSAALDEHCKIDYSGIMPASIENVDLCIILSNALDNAIEACRELDSPCTICLTAGEQQGYFVMSLRNPTARTDSFYDIPTTTKPEKEQHGMGLYNIESTVKKHEGQMKIKCENGMFELMLTMKL